MRQSRSVQYIMQLMAHKCTAMWSMALHAAHTRLNTTPAHNNILLHTHHVPRHVCTDVSDAPYHVGEFATTICCYNLLLQSMHGEGHTTPEHDW
jgi:hypothetical protein